MADLHPEWLIEGRCPAHGTPLERREDHGWCPECRCGWAHRGDEVVMHITADTSRLERALGRFRKPTDGTAVNRRSTDP